MTNKKLRILCLHRMRHNPAIVDIDMEPLRRALGDSAEFVHVNGVSPARGEPDALVRRHHMNKAPFYARYNVRRLEEFEDQDGEWFFQYEGLEDAILYMDEQLQKLGPFDAVLGFSQSAVLMPILAMYYLCISVCGWRVRGYPWKFLFDNDDGEKLLVPLPSIHIAGKKDPLHCGSEEFAHMYAGDANATKNRNKVDRVKKLFFEFDEGHQFPLGDKYAAFYDELAKSIHEMYAAAPKQLRQDRQSLIQQQLVYSRLTDHRDSSIAYSCYRESSLANSSSGPNHRNFERTNHRKSISGLVNFNFNFNTRTCRCGSEFASDDPRTNWLTSGL